MRRAGAGEPAVALLAPVLLALAVLAAACGGASSSGTAERVVAAEFATAEVVRSDLVETATLQGEVGYGEPRPLPTNTTGVVTWLPENGAAVAFGEPLMKVNGDVIVLLRGGEPSYRRFALDMTAGPDVAVLEQNLIDLGYGADIVVDDDFTTATQDAIERFQEDRGIEATGNFELGSVVFSTGPVRIADSNVEPGQSVTPQVAVLNVTDVAQRIFIDLAADDRELIDVGETVTITMPDNTAAPGLVSDIASVASRRRESLTGQLSDPVIEVIVDFEGDPPAGTFEAAPVDVEVTKERTTDVLVVPVDALIAVAEGGHAVEVVRGGTDFELVRVEVVTFVDTSIAVTGALQPGDRVVIPG